MGNFPCRWNGLFRSKFFLLNIRGRVFQCRVVYRLSIIWHPWTHIPVCPPASEESASPDHFDLIKKFDFRSIVFYSIHEKPRWKGCRWNDLIIFLSAPSLPKMNSVLVVSFDGFSFPTWNPPTILVHSTHTEVSIIFQATFPTPLDL